MDTALTTQQPVSSGAPTTRRWKTRLIIFAGKLLVVVSALAGTFAIGHLTLPLPKSGSLVLLGLVLVVFAFGVWLCRRTIRSWDFGAMVLVCGFLGLGAAPMMTAGLWYPEREFSDSVVELLPALVKAHNLGARPTTITELVDGKFLKADSYYLFKRQQFYDASEYRWTWEFDGLGQFVGEIGVQTNRDPQLPACVTSFAGGKKQIMMFGLWPWEECKLPETFKPIGPAK